MRRKETSSDPLLWDADTAAYMRMLNAAHAAHATSVELPMEQAMQLVPIAQRGAARALDRYLTEWQATAREYARKVEAFRGISGAADGVVPMPLVQRLLPVLHSGLRA